MHGEWTAVATVHSERTDPADTDDWGAVVSSIVLDDRFGAEALTGLADFSHVEVIFFFDRLAERENYRDIRSPRGRADLPAVGVFADRGPRRPNRLGVTRCEIVSVDGTRLRVRGLDAVDGTAVLDLKPVLNAFTPAQVREPDWAALLMRDYWSR